MIIAFSQGSLVILEYDWNPLWLKVIKYAGFFLSGSSFAVSEGKKVPLEGCTCSVSSYKACKIVFQEKLRPITGECFQHTCQNCEKGNFA